MKRTRYTAKETAEMIDMKNQGATCKEIAEMMGRTAKAVSEHLRYAERCEAKKAMDAEPEAEKAPKTLVIGDKTLVKQKTLNDFTIREIVKNLYDRGCRIRNNKLYVVQEREVKLSDII